MVAINNLQNTQPPLLPNSYLSGYFKAIFQHEATHATNQGEPLSETNRRPHREAAGDLQPDRPGSVKARTRRCFTALHLSHLAPLLRGPFADTPLSPHEFTRTKRIKDLFLPGEIDNPPPPRPRQLSKMMAVAMSDNHPKRFSLVSKRGSAAAITGAFSPSFSWRFAVLSGKVESQECYECLISARTLLPHTRCLLEQTLGFFPPHLIYI